ncbi:hypothetical protein [Burkholderia pseudomallei]|uniref:hypothetical protein n=1 Tax=Burkholderia pseudomallei TaxID=28450 RepID=UPI00313FE306
MCVMRGNRATSARSGGGARRAVSGMRRRASSRVPARRHRGDPARRDGNPAVSDPAIVRAQPRGARASRVDRHASQALTGCRSAAWPPPPCG